MDQIIKVAWDLNENSEKIVVAPEYWQANFKSNSDIIPENWYILENK